MQIDFYVSRIDLVSFELELFLVPRSTSGVTLVVVLEKVAEAV